MLYIILFPSKLFILIKVIVKDAFQHSFINSDFMVQHPEVFWESTYILICMFWELFSGATNGDARS